VNESVDVAGALARRERIAKHALRIGVAGVIVCLAGSYFITGVGLSAWGPVISVFNILTLLASPLAFAIAVANLSASDSFALRFLQALVGGAIALVALLMLALKVFALGGGKFHI
jgi:hypothetical protein